MQYANRKTNYKRSNTKKEHHFKGRRKKIMNRIRGKKCKFKFVS